MNQPRIAVPTATVIAAKIEDSNVVALLRSPKHGNKLVFPGGRVRIGDENYLQCAIREAEEEVGIVLQPAALQFFCFSQKARRDVRKMKIKKYNEGITLDPVVEQLEAEAFYCFDCCFSTHVKGGTELKAGEEGAPFWQDLRQVKPEDFALDHSILAEAWLKWIKDAQRPRFGEL